MRCKLFNYILIAVLSISIPGGLQVKSSFANSVQLDAATSSATWTQVFATHYPQARYIHGMAYDSSRGVMVLFGGDSTGASRLNDTWEYDGVDWHQIIPTQSPPGRVNINQTLVYDSSRGKVIVFGGLSSTSYMNDTWEYNGSTWNKITTSQSPSARDAHAMAYDSGRKITVLFGGYSTSNHHLGDTWEYDGITWHLVDPSQSPPGRSHASIAYDSRRGVIVLFGGRAIDNTQLNDTWEYDGTTWHQILTPRSPPMRESHSITYDSNRGIVVLFGGKGNAGTLFNDTWEYNGTTWQQIEIAQSPSVREATSLAYDSQRQVAVFFGGGYWTDRLYVFNDTWEYHGEASTGCSVPFFSQVDDEWKNHPLRTSDGQCSAYCSTIGRCGCTLTSAAMAFNTYGANTNPPQLSDCMDTSACPYNWTVGANCSSDKASFVGRPGFSWNRLELELNQNHRPVILGMCKNGTCHLDYDDDPNTYAQTHWVLVFDGQGDNPTNYHIHDPAFKCGADLLLSTRSSNWTFTYMGIYQGTVPCSSLTVLTPPCASRGANPQPVTLPSLINSTSTLSTDEIAAPMSIISGTVWIYSRTEITMTLEVTASSSIGNITDMVIWSDSISNTNWQTYTPFVWLPVSDFVYVRFSDNLGNVTGIYTDTINPVGPPTMPFVEIYLPLVMRN